MHGRRASWYVFVAGLALVASLAACRNGLDNHLGATGTGGTSDHGASDTTSVVSGSGAATPIDRLPGSVLGAFALNPGGCTSDYGPLVVEPTRLDFGWGRAVFQSIKRRGATFEIDAVLTAEGQPEGPQRQHYVIAAPPGSNGIRLNDGERTRAYAPCAGKTSGVSVSTGQSASSKPTTPNVDTESAAKGVLPMIPGVYVVSGTDCDSPANAAFRIYTGDGISGSATRDCRATIKSRDGDTFVVAQSCIDTYTSERTTVSQSIAVQDARHFSLREGDEKSTSVFGLCVPGTAPDYLERLQN